MGNSSEKSLRPGEATYGDIVELTKGIKSAWTDIRNETSNKLMDSVTDGLMQVNKSKESLNFKWEDNKINITFTF